MPDRAPRFRPWLLGAVAAPVVRLLHATWRVTVVDPHGVADGTRDGESPAIVAFWHRRILTMLSHFRGYRVCVPVSQSKDGEYVAQVMRRFGMAPVRGSTSRGALSALRGVLAHTADRWSPAITPDGPRGPKFTVSPGFIMLARRSGLPVHPIGMAARKAWTAKSWDEFVVPKPWTRVAIVFGPALDLDESAGTEAICQSLKDSIVAATEEAQRVVAK